MNRSMFWLGAALAAWSGFAGAQLATPAPTGAAAVADLPPPAAGFVRVPANTPVDLEILDPLSSKTSSIDQMFAIRLSDAILVDGKIIVPAGVTGRGQVVHAAKARAMGKAGELILAARYLDCGDTHVPLRGLHLVKNGDDNSGEAIVASALFTPVGFFISGGNSIVSAGTHAHARLATAVDLRVDPAPACVAPASTITK